MDSIRQVLSPYFSSKAARKYTPMDRVPPELWPRIFSFACVDAGATGRSLSIVSKGVQYISELTKLQTISISGRNQILAFAKLLEGTSKVRRCIRHFFVANERGESKEGITSKRIRHIRNLGINLVRSRRQCEEEASEESMAIVQDALTTILREISETVTTLGIMLTGYGSYYLKFDPISFPCLNELTIGGTMLWLFPCSSLKRLFIVNPSYHFAECTLLTSIVTLAPSITHLQISGLSDSYFARELQMAVGHGEPEPGDSTTQQLRTGMGAVIKVMIRPGPRPREGWCGNPMIEYDMMLNSLRRIESSDCRLVLLPVQGEDIYKPGALQEERLWLERLAGGEGPWYIKK